MTQKSIAFEKKVKEIYELLLQKTATVTWNDSIPDPDNPKQSRQIDITIKYDDTCTHVECRDHKSPQNTKWIEELIGRKISLEATAMIAVSSSGFTEGALKKAKKYGIYTYDLRNLTKEEINSWLDKTTLKVTYYVFSDLKIIFALNSLEGIDSTILKNNIFYKPEYLNVIFNEIKYYFNSSNNSNPFELKSLYPQPFFIQSTECGNMTIKNNDVTGVEVSGSVDILICDYKLPSVKIFSNSQFNNESIVSIEENQKLNTEIFKSSTGFARVCIDLNSVPKNPPNAIFSGIIEFDKLSGSKKNPPQFEFIGHANSDIDVQFAEYGFVILHK